MSKKHNLSFCLILLSVLLLGKSFDVQASAIDTAKLQLAGNVGVVSGSVGFASSTRLYSLDILYGYAPADMIGVDIHTVGIKGTIAPFKLTFKKNTKLVPFYFGTAIVYILGEKYDTQRGKKYPESYYGRIPLNLHLAPFFGFQLEKKVRSGRKFGVYTEIGTMDVYLEAYFNNRDAIEFSELWSSAIGITYFF